jgi:hypothetical protein
LLTDNEAAGSLEHEVLGGQGADNGLFACVLIHGVAPAELTRFSIYLVSWNAYAAWALPGRPVDKEVRTLGSMPL